MTCAECAGLNETALSTFNRMRRIGSGVSMLSNLIYSEIERHFPGLILSLSNPDLWVIDGEKPPWMAPNDKSLDARSIHFDVVEGPVEFGASYVRHQCKSCHFVRNIFVVGAGFVASTRHVLATSLGKGLPLSDLRRLIDNLWTDGATLRSGPHAPVQIDSVIPGIAWILCHEIAHAIGRPLLDRSLLDEAPEWCREDVARELDADIAAIDMLVERVIMSSDGVDFGPRLAQLFDGIELMIRGFTLIDSIREGRPKTLNDYPQTLEDGSPSPALRWQFLDGQRRFYEQKLNLPRLAQNEFVHWDKTVASLFESRGERMTLEFSADLVSEAEALLTSDSELTHIATTVSIDSAGSRLGRRAEPDVENLSGISPVWTEFKEQFYLFVCTNDPAYNELRDQVKTAEKVTKSVVVPSIAGGIGAVLGVAAGILTPFVALAILGVVQLGKNAWCRAKAPKVPPIFSGVLALPAPEGTTPEPVAPKS